MFFPLTIIPAFVREVRRFRPHVVQVHESDGALVALVTKIISAIADPAPVLVALLQVSYVEEIRAVRPLRYKQEILGRPGSAEKRFRLFRAPIHVVFGCLTAWLADLVLAPSMVTACEIQQDYQAAEIGVVPNVTGGLGWDVASEMLPAERYGFLYVGRLRIRKGVEVLLSSMRELRRNHPDARLRIVGDGEQMQALKEMVERLELQGSVEFLGRQSPEEVRRLLASSLALVVPSIYEGMPLVVLEAMERATPVVASSVSGIPEVVVDGETGWLVPQEDPIRLFEALSEVLADPEGTRRRGLAGQERVSSRYQPDNAAALWEQEISSFLPVESVRRR
jgi:glycosyltransferase involved in cell wall biosynthesis